jgi:predicted phosphodiesterase
LKGNVLRLAVLADIHGNLPALEAVLDDARAQAIDGYVVAGDNVWGAQGDAVVARVRTLSGWVIRGNNEEYLLRLAAGNAPPAWHTHRQFAVLRWAYRTAGRATLDYFATLPAQCVVAPDGAAPVRVVHGTLTDANSAIFPDRDPGSLDRALAQVDELVLVCAHTHIQWIIEQDGRLALNPGSIGRSFNGDPRARYALLAWDGARWRAEPRAVPYDLARQRAAFVESGLLAEGGPFARAILLATETGRNVSRAFLNHAHALAGWPASGVIPDDVWERAEATFAWERFAPA